MAVLYIMSKIKKIEMLLQFKNKRISSIISVIPANEVNFMDEIGNYSFTQNQKKKIKKTE